MCLKGKRRENNKNRTYKYSIDLIENLAIIKFHKVDAFIFFLCFITMCSNNNNKVTIERQGKDLNWEGNKIRKLLLAYIVQGR